MEQGERAIRAHLKAVRAAAKKPSCLNEAVSNRMDEVLARKDAETLLKPPEDLVRSSGEAIRPNFRLPHIVDTLQEPSMIGVVASEQRLDLAACVGSRVAESAVDAAQSAQAGNSLEKMLCRSLSSGYEVNYLAVRFLDFHACCRILSKLFLNYFVYGVEMVLQNRSVPSVPKLAFVIHLEFPKV